MYIVYKIRDALPESDSPWKNGLIGSLRRPANDRIALRPIGDPFCRRAARRFADCIYDIYVCARVQRQHSVRSVAFSLARYRT